MVGMCDNFRLQSEGGNPLHGYEVFTVIGAIGDGSQSLIYKHDELGADEPVQMGFEVVDTELLDGYCGPNMVALTSLSRSGIENIQTQAVLEAVRRIPGVEGAMPEMDANEYAGINLGNISPQMAETVLAEGDLLELAGDYRASLHNTDVGGYVDITDPEHVAHIVSVEGLYAQISVAADISGYANAFETALESTKIEEFGVSEADADRARNAFGFEGGLEGSVLEHKAGVGQSL